MGVYLIARHVGGRRRWIALFPLALATGWTATQLAARFSSLLLAAGCFLYVLFALISVSRPLVFVFVYLAAVVVLPPIYLSSFPDTPLYVSTALFPIALAILALRLPGFRSRLDAVGKGLGAFLVGTGLSLPFAYWLSGEEIARQSLLRWLMLGQTALVYLIIRGPARRQELSSARWLVPLLLVAAMASAAYGIFDFFWPVSMPHPAADQFIWLGSAVVRRAQGAFYEAANFANMCAFFLAITSAALLARQERTLRLARPLLPLYIATFSLALFVSFTRSAWACLLAAVLVFTAVSRQVKWRRALGFLIILGLPLGTLWFYSPELWSYFVRARIGELMQILVDPNLASSGRFDTWAQVYSILQDHPQYMLFGIGYKTLPFTRLFHQEIVTDNGFLNLLLETGILGLGGFLIFSASVFRTFLRLARERHGPVAFWGALLFSFWCGEWVQMMAVDAYTYWRNMVVFLAMMAYTLNSADRSEA